MKRCGVYFKGDTYFVSPMNQTTSRVWIGDQPTQLGASVENGDLGHAVLDALTESRLGVPHPTPGEWPARQRQFLQAVGAKTWSRFSVGTFSVGVSLDGEMIRCEPEENKGPRDGFVPIPDAAVDVRSSAGPEAVGLAVRNALALAKNG